MKELKLKNIARTATNILCIRRANKNG